MTPREQQLFDLGNNFPGLLTDSELKEWSRLRDLLETEPSAAEQDQWSRITVVVSMLMGIIVLL